MYIPPQTLKEAYAKGMIPEAGGLKEAAFARLATEAAMHPIIRRALQEGLYQDAAAALEAMQHDIMSVVYPRLIARDLLRVVPTVNTSERFYLGKRGYILANRGHVAEINSKPDTPVDITASIVNTGGESWSEDFVEDVPWNIMNFESEGLAGEFARGENADCITLFNAISTGNLAGGAEVTVTDTNPTWAQILELIGKFGDDYPDVIALNTVEFLGLFKLDQFVNALYKGADTGPRLYSVNHALLGIKFIGHSQVTKTLAINTKRAGVMLMRSDMNVMPWEDKAQRKFGVNARERYGMGILRPDAVARGTY